MVSKIGICFSRFLFSASMLRFGVQINNTKSPWHACVGSVRLLEMEMVGRQSDMWKYMAPRTCWNGGPKRYMKSSQVPVYAWSYMRRQKQLELVGSGNGNVSNVCEESGKRREIQIFFGDGCLFSWSDCRIYKHVILRNASAKSAEDAGCQFKVEKRKSWNRFLLNCLVCKLMSMLAMLRYQP